MNSLSFSRLDRSPWFHLLGGPIWWSVHFLGSYLWIEFACRAKLPTLDSVVLGLTVLSWSVLIFTLLATLAASYVGWAAYRSWRRLKGSHKTNEPSSWKAESGLFMALSGIALSALFALAILLGGLPALVLEPCM